MDRDAMNVAFRVRLNLAAYQLHPERAAHVPEGLEDRTYNPDKARQLLTEAGFSGGASAPRYMPIRPEIGM